MDAATILKTPLLLNVMIRAVSPDPQAKRATGRPFCLHM